MRPVDRGQGMIMDNVRSVHRGDVTAKVRGIERLFLALLCWSIFRQGERKENITERENLLFIFL